jgi:hypothetical protein
VLAGILADRVGIVLDAVGDAFSGVRRRASGEWICLEFQA